MAACFLRFDLVTIQSDIFAGGNRGNMFTLNETTGVLRTTRPAVSILGIY